MMNLKNLLNENKAVWFEIEQTEKQKFLEFAKKNGCVWLNDKEIDPLADDCMCHMSIHNDYKIAKVAHFIWYRNTEVKKFLFTEFLNGIEATPDSRLISSVLND